MSAMPDELRQLAELCALLDGFDLEPVNDAFEDQEIDGLDFVTVLDLSPERQLLLHKA